MKKLIINFVLLIVFSLLVAVDPGSEAAAQVGTSTADIQKQLKKANVEIPFVDRDGDGVNDLLQNGWGLRFLKRYNNRNEAWNQIIEQGEDGTILVDTDGDGTADTPLRELRQKRMGELIDTDGDGVADTAFGQYMRGLMNELVDTDGDGIADTSLRDYMKKQFQLLDEDGDGIPDNITREQLQEDMQEMRAWRQQIKENLENGLPAFTDENGDGIPDDLPSGFGWLGRHKKSKGIGGE